MLFFPISLLVRVVLLLYFFCFKYIVSKTFMYFVNKFAHKKSIGWIYQNSLVLMKILQVKKLYFGTNDGVVGTNGGIESRNSGTTGINKGIADVNGGITPINCSYEWKYCGYNTLTWSCSQQTLSGSRNFSNRWNQGSGGRLRLSEFWTFSFVLVYRFLKFLVKKKGWGWVEERRWKS